MDANRPQNDPSSSHSNNPNVFDDEFAVEGVGLNDQPPVADGFRPGQPSHLVSGPQHTLPNHILNQTHAHHASVSSEPPSSHNSLYSPISPVLAPSSAAPSADKIDEGESPSPLAPRNSIMKRGDPMVRRSSARHSQIANPQFTGSGLAHRVSVSSTNSFATMFSSQAGSAAHEPSHPYGLYHQETIPAQATGSSAASSAMPMTPQRAYTNTGPTHPYAMYSQNIGITDHDAAPVAAQSIPVGFPGMATGYHRRIGPDGEELDIVGPYGHTEQLPPYTRYAEDSPTKTPTTEPNVAMIPAAAPAASSSSPSSESPSASASTSRPVLALTPTLSETNSPTAPATQEASNVRHEFRPEDVRASRVPQFSSANSISRSSDQSEKSWKEKSWREKRKTLLFGGRIPCWIVLLIIILIIILAVIVGAAAGALVSRNVDKKQRPRPYPGASVVTYVTTATMFDASPIARPSNLSPTNGTWSVPITTPQELNKNCLPLVNQSEAWSCQYAGGNPMILKVLDTPSRVPGAQLVPGNAPEDGIFYGVQQPSLEVHTLDFVEDRDAIKKGPAYHIQAYYNKVVVLELDRLGLAPNSKREYRVEKSYENKRRVKTLPGEKVWFCHWDQTFIEVYMYPLYPPPATSTTGTTTSTSSGPVVSATAFPGTRTSSGAPPQSASTMSSIYKDGRRRRDEPNYFPVFPQAVKIEERRLPNSPQAYCIQMQILDDKSTTLVRNPDNTDIRVLLQESNPPLSEFNKNALLHVTTTPNKVVVQRGDPPGACHCQWEMVPPS